MHQCHQSKRPIIILKLDFAKAFETVEHSAMLAMMTHLGFPELWLKWMRMIFSSGTSSILLNGVPGKQFSCKRGVHQGDPLSPYLFILCAEGLSALLQKAECERKIEGIKICRGAPRVDHLFFADDSLILMRARASDAQELRHILEVYERASGQVINKDKSSIMFSPNTRQEERGQVRSSLLITNEASSEKYLGLPVSIGKSRSKAF